MKAKIFEGKAMDDIIRASTNYFHHDSEHLDIKIIHEKKGLFGIGAHIAAEVSLKVDPIQMGLEYLQQILIDLNLTATIDVIREDKGVTYNINSDNNGFLIGKNGKALQSLQLLVQQAVGRHANSFLKISVDIDAYRRKQVQRLEQLAHKIANEVIQTKIDAKLDPMNAFERRIIHQTLANLPHIKTLSTGEEPNRSLIIKYK